MNDVAAERLNPYAVLPDAQAAMLVLQQYIMASGLDFTLMKLVMLRASQINGCAKCVIMHTREARKSGETDERLHLVTTWREALCFTKPERAALEWTDALTQLNNRHVDQETYERVKAEFSDEDMVKLTLQICSINAWNRLNVAFAIPFAEKPRISIAAKN